MSHSEPQDQSAIKQVEREHEELRTLIGATNKSLAEPSSRATIAREQLAKHCDWPSMQEAILFLPRVDWEKQRGFWKRQTGSE